MKTKVCHMTSGHNRYDKRVFQKECISLVKHGFDVTLLLNDGKCEEVKNGVKIISLKRKPKNRLERIFTSKRLFNQKAIEINADIYHFHDPELIAVGKKLKRKGKTVIFDSHEDFPDDMLRKQWIPKPIRFIVSKLYGIYEYKASKQFDVIITVTSHIYTRFSKYCKRVELITNFPIVHEEKDIYRCPQNYICHVGAISELWNIESTMKAIAKFPNLVFLIAGPNNESYISKLKMLPEWSCVEYIGFIEHSKVFELYSKSIAGLSLYFDNDNISSNGSLGVTKIFEYMESKLPVICSNNENWTNIIEKNSCGICVDPKDEKQITDAIRTILGNHVEAEKMGENGRNAVIEKYNWKIQEEKLISLYNDLCRRE